MVVPALKRLLILGGTTEARELATATEKHFRNRIYTITALAGSTRTPRQLVGAVRIGGFGGKVGLTNYLRSEKIDIVVDATHPFAVQISAHATYATKQAHIPRLALVRPSWQAVHGDRWIETPDPNSAVTAIPPESKRIFLSVGSRNLSAFSERKNIWYLVRMIDPPDPVALPGNSQLLLGRGPFSESDEYNLLVKHQIDCVVTRASGGAATIGKLSAARSLSLPVVMIKRPPPPRGTSAQSVKEAVTWLANRTDPA